MKGDLTARGLLACKTGVKRVQKVEEKGPKRLKGQKGVSKGQKDDTIGPFSESPTKGLEPSISPLGGVRRVHWATQAMTYIMF